VIFRKALRYKLALVDKKSAMRRKMCNTANHAYH